MVASLLKWKPGEHSNIGALSSVIADHKIDNEVKIVPEDRKNPLEEKCEENEYPEEVEEWEPPDGGYGWVMVVISFLILFLFASYSQLGIFLLPLQNYFNVSTTTITWLNAAHTTTGRILGIFIGQILQKVGGRIMLTTATLLLASGYFISSYMENITVMFITFGLLPSLACGCLLSIGATSSQQYFTTKRSVANGLACTGISVGVFSWSPLGEKLIEMYGWKTTFRIEAAIILALGLVLVIFLRPPGNQNVWLHCRKLRKTKNKKEVLSTPNSNSPCSNCTKLCDFSLLRNPAVSVFWMGTTISSLGHLVNSTYMPVRAELLNIDASSAAFTTSLYGIAGGIATPIFAFIGNFSGVRRDLMLAMAMILSGIITLVFTLFTTSTLLLVGAGLLGFLSGAFLSMAFVIVVDMIDPKMIAVASGFHAATLGIAHLILHPTSGILLDETNNPQAPFYMAGVALLLGGSILCIVPIIRKWQYNKMYHSESLTTTVASLDTVATCNNQEGRDQTEDDFYIIHL